MKKAFSHWSEKATLTSKTEVDLKHIYKLDKCLKNQHEEK